MIELDIRVDIAAKTISSFNLSVSNTPDQISVLYLRKTTLTLSLLFNVFLGQGKVKLQICKKAIKTPIHKKGPRNTTLNNRLVLLTSVICRIEEQIIYNHITSHLIERHLISGVQHSFVKQRSSLIQHLTFLDELD